MENFRRKFPYYEQVFQPDNIRYFSRHLFISLNFNIPSRLWHHTWYHVKIILVLKRFIYALKCFLAKIIFTWMGWIAFSTLSLQLLPWIITKKWHWSNFPQRTKFLFKIKFFFKKKSLWNMHFDHRNLQMTRKMQ